MRRNPLSLSRIAGSFVYYGTGGDGYVYFAISVVLKRIAISEYFTYVNAYSQLKSTILNISSIYNQLYSNSLFANDYLEFMESDAEETLNLKGKQLNNIQEVEFRNVTFRYPNSNVNALDNVSFKIESGQKVAIVGKNGAGKTTIIKLLLRLYDPLLGDVFVNGINIKEYDTISLRKAMCVLFQDYSLFAFSIKDNISLGKDINTNKIWEALQKLGLGDKVEKLPASLDTPITSQLYPGGVELSGGESQKLAISRLYVSNAKLIAMDEPTSSLDPQAEYLLYKQIMENSDRGAIFIVVSHRLTLTHKMSRILVIE